MISPDEVWYGQVFPAVVISSEQVAIGCKIAVKVPVLFDNPDIELMGVGLSTLYYCFCLSWAQSSHLLFMG